MNENLSIDEIIKQAEEIRKKTVHKAQSALEEINNSAQEITDRQIEVPAVEPENIVIEPKRECVKEYKTNSSQKTAVVDKDALSKAQEKTTVVSQKTRAVPSMDKTGVVKSVKDVKKKKTFFDSTSAYEPLYSKRPPDIIEKSATIRSKSKFDKTLDLEEIPTIVAVDELDKTKLNFTGGQPADSSKNEDIEEGYQIVLDGFEDSTDEISKIDEELAEKQLKERRKDKINKFRLFSPDDIEEASLPENEIKDVYKPDDKVADLISKLEKARGSQKTVVIITAVLTLLLGLFTFFDGSSYMPSVFLDSTNYLITVLVLFVAVIVVNFKAFIHGFKLKGGINSDFPISVSSIIVLAHTVLMLFDGDFLIDSTTSYAVASAFAFLVSGVGKYTMLTRVIANFNFIVNRKDIYSVETILNQVDAAIISRGLLTGETNLKTSIKTDEPTKFLDIACSNDPSNSIAKTTGIVMMVLSAVAFGVFTFITKNWHIGFNVAICALCISVPCISIYNVNNSLLGVSKQLNKKGAMINGFEGAAIVDDANAIVLEAQDLFGPRSCQIHGIKTFNGAKADDVILKTAAVIMKTKSPLASVFDDVIIGKQTILPEVDGVVYEDRMGTSAWIYRKKILVGTRDLLIHHGVTVPKEEYEKKYTRKGRKILYLAVTGKLMAMFVVSYNADPQLKKSLKRLEKSGMTILVKSADPFINDESICELFSLPEGYVRVMSSSNGRAFEKYSDMYVEKSPAYVLHNGTALGFVSAMGAAENIQDTRRLLSVLISFGCAVGFGVVALLGAVGGYSQLSALSVVAFQAVWCIFMEIVSKLKRLGI
ncbi:MAG: hypothetical protein PUE08_01755 [Eubacteriales bacterium]|nr:hypothetical protein [Eubacteriales bacterium]